MAMGLLFAVYILVNKELGIEAPFPGPSSRLDLVDDISYAPAIADMTLWAATNEHTKNEDFNNASGDTVVYRYFWPELASYFGLQVRFRRNPVLSFLGSRVVRSATSPLSKLLWPSGPRTSALCGSKSSKSTVVMWKFLIGANGNP